MGDSVGAGNRNLEGSKAHSGTSLTDAALGGQAARSEQSSARLNPDWVGWLMGWPIGWESLEPLAELRWEPLDREPDIPRVTTEKKDRTNRLKALGNGIVPACAAAAWNSLLHRLGVGTSQHKRDRDRLTLAPAGVAGSREPF